MSITEPGIYCDITEADYATWPQLRRSHLAKGFDSMRKLKAAWDGVSGPQTEPQRFGAAFHARALQPRLYDATYAVVPDFAQDEPGKYKNYRATSEYKSKLAAFQSANAGREYLSSGDAAAIEAMVAAIYANPIASLLKSGGTNIEVCNRSQLDRSKRSGGPWKTDEFEMSRKTPIIRAAKRWPKTAEMAMAIHVEEQRDLGREAAAIEVSPRKHKTQTYGTLSAADPAVSDSDLDALKK
jgi:hypothetical protein